MYSNSYAFKKDKLGLQLRNNYIGLQLRNNYICGLVINYLAVFAPPSLVVKVKFKLNDTIFSASAEFLGGQTQCFSIFTMKDL
jgi:hypothetical protein